ncbi:MAG TPA: hypothetical protein VGD61_23525 [Pyrinomonadaceae bacterium]
MISRRVASSFCEEISNIVLSSSCALLWLYSYLSVSTDQLSLCIALMNRIPFRQYWAIMFVCCFVIFGLASLTRSRGKIRIDG